MRTADQCRAKALEKLGLAKAYPQHRRRLMKAADAWLFLANQLEAGEAILREARAEHDTLGYVDTQAANSHRTEAAS
jgi:hypothetical protein